MERHPIRVLAWGLWAVATAFALAAFVFLLLSGTTPPPSGSFGFRGFSAVFAIAFGTTGLLIASRVPSNPIGWLFLAIGIGSGLQELAQQYAIYGVLHRPGAVPAADVAAWTTQWIWIPLTAVAIVFIPLLYPTGRLPSRRWRPFAITAGILISLDAAAFALAPGPLEEFPAVVNPFGLPAARGLLEIAEIGLLAYMLALVAAVVSLVIRYRRASPDERLQLKWLVLVGTLAGIALVATFAMQVFTGSTPRVLEYLIVLAVAAVPVAIGIAILRYRLYDIDLVIKKTVVYAVLAVLLFAIGLPVAWAIGGLVVWAAGGRDAYAYLAGGIVIGLLVWPLRRLATRIADRLVYGRRATPYEVLSEFSGRVAETYAADDVLARMAQVLGEAVGADAATVWLGRRDRARPVATWPAGEPTDDALPVSAVDVRHRDDVLGALSVRMPPNDPMTPERERLIRDLASQAGLVLRNAALIEDLKASRQRLVAAQDQERRRLERDIHDGAQQQLVALAVKLGLVEHVLPPGANRAAAMLAEAKSETNEALETLRDLARGIYPPLLADEGLASALTAQGRKSPLSVTVESDGIGRFGEDVEAAVYFSCLEALTNVAKYAGASAATVRLARSDGGLTFEVTDDGVGFDPDAAERGSGLQGIADRLAALGGELTVRSGHGEGTTISGTLRVEAEP